MGGGKGGSKSGGAKDYYGSIAGLVCAGPVDELVAIIVDGKTVWEGPIKRTDVGVTNPTVEMVTAGDSETNEADAAEHIITRDLENQKGALWSDQKIDFNESFTINAEICLGTKDADGADGMALVFQAKGNHIVSDGGGLGYQGISP